MRYFIRLSFSGQHYHGWQVQKNANSIQEELNRTLGMLLKNEAFETTGCGRTDTGVHAKEFFAHFDHHEEVDRDHLVGQLNAILPGDISIRSLGKMPDDAHARFDAISRTYVYRMHHFKDPFLQGWSWFVQRKPDTVVMNDLSTVLMSHEDFSCFSKSGTDTATNNCRITQATWETNEYETTFTISADRFLRNMVRAIVGTLLEGGNGKLDKSGLERILNSRDRSEAGRSVPAHGLYLTEVKYPYPVP